METKGSKEFDGIPYGGIYEGDPYYCITDYDDESNVFFYYISLNSDSDLTWDSYEVDFRDQRTFDLIFLYTDVFRLSDECDRIITVGPYVHIFHHYYKSFSKFEITRFHLILDMDTHEWSIDDAYDDLPESAKIGNREWSQDRSRKELPPSHTAEIFSDGSQLWIISSAKELCKSTLHRFDQESEQWITTGEISDDDYRFRVRECPITVGSRVIFTKSSTLRHDLSVRPLLYVLELEPTLFDRAAVAVSKYSRAALAILALPPGMKDYVQKFLNEEDVTYPKLVEDENMDNDEDLSVVGKATHRCASRLRSYPFIAIPPGFRILPRVQEEESLDDAVGYESEDEEEDVGITTSKRAFRFVPLPPGMYGPPTMVFLTEEEAIDDQEHEEEINDEEGLMDEETLLSHLRADSENARGIMIWIMTSERYCQWPTRAQEVP